MAKTPNVDAIANYAGKFERKLFSTLLNGMDFQQDITGIYNLKEALNMTKLTVGDGARPYTSTKTVNANDLVYTGRKLSVNVGKRDLEIEVMKYINTWQSEVMAGNLDPYKVPLGQYVWAEVIASLQAELNDKTCYFGFDAEDAVAYDALDTYTAGDYITYGTPVPDYYKALSNTNAGENPETHPAKWQKVNAEAIAVGLGTLIANAVGAGDVVPVNTGTIDNSAVYAYAQFKKMWRSLKPAYRKNGATIFCSYNSWDLLYDDFEDKVGKYTDTDQNGNFYLKGTARKCMIKPASWMGDSGRLICTPKANLLFGTNLLSDLNKINTVKQLHTLEATIVFILGFQIRDLDALKVNDVA